MAPTKKTKQRVELSFFKVFLYIFLIGFTLMIFIGYSMLSGDNYRDQDTYLPDFFDPHSDDSSAAKEIIHAPIILWWTGFTAEPGKYDWCGKDQCFFTIDKHYYHHPQTKAFMFYGSDFNPKDVPLPRKPDHEWGLLHEESPKNNYLYSYIEALELFNHTSTFSRLSDLPLVTQFIESIEWLQSTKYLVPTKEKNALLGELAPLVYVHSDCDTPSDRDSYAKLLMAEMGVDSYGTCLNNRQLPKHLTEPLAGFLHNDFFKIMARYKFTLAMENAVCDDYVTEKIWRPLMLGSVPVILGSPKIKEVLPDNHSAIIIDDFKSVKELTTYLKYLNDNDDEYEKYLQWKRTGITNQWLIDHMKQRIWSIIDTWKEGRTNFIDEFQCLVCNRIHENIERQEKGMKKKTYAATDKHFGCPEPMQFDATGKPTEKNIGWMYDWTTKKYEARSLRYFADKNIRVTKGEFNAKVSELRYYNKR